MLPENAPNPAREGELIAGKYLVEQVIGRGGMGVVVSAMHVELDQRVAIKFLLPAAAANPDIAARFSREARAAARVHSEHVARVIDVGQMDDGSPFMVMEYMEGQDLERVLDRHGLMPVDVAVGYVLQACEAIAVAHSIGIIHRDLKPSNLFLANRPNGPPIVKVLDFGISKSTLDAGQGELTGTTAMLGSPHYMSPEQMTSSKSVDARSDIWSLGIVFYRLLVGGKPFHGDTMPELVASILQNEPDPIGHLRPDIPPGLAAAIQHCLEKSPARRFANVAELARAIAPFGPRGCQVSVERIAHVLGASQPSPLVTGDSWSHVRPVGSTPSFAGQIDISFTGSQSLAQPSVVATPPSRRGMVVAVACLVGALAGLFGGVAIILRFMGGSSTTSTDSFHGAPSAQVSPPPPSAAPPPPVVEATSLPVAADPIPPTVAPPQPPVVAAATPPSAPPATERHTKTNVVTHPPPAPPTAAPKCHLVSYPDSDGNLHFKQECK